MKQTTACIIVIILTVSLYLFLAYNGDRHSLTHLLVGDILILIWGAKATAALATYILIDKYIIQRYL